MISGHQVLVMQHLRWGPGGNWDPCSVRALGPVGIGGDGCWW